MKVKLIFQLEVIQLFFDKNFFQTMHYFNVTFIKI